MHTIYYYTVNLQPAIFLLTRNCILCIILGILKSLNISHNGAFDSMLFRLKKKHYI